MTKMGPATLMQAATICRRFYIDGDSKSKIADELGLSRFQVARLLQQSIEQGIIRFHIEIPGRFDADFSEKVRKAFGLRRAVVITIPAGDSTPNVIRQRVGAAAAAVLSETVTEHDVLGIGWGRTLSVMVDEISEMAHCPVVQMGGMIGTVHENSLELVRKVTGINRGRAYPLYVPLILQDAHAAASLRAQAGIAAAVKLFDSISVGAVAIGSWDPPDSQLLDGLSDDDRDMLENRGIVGEICSSMLRDDGSTVTDLQERSVAVSIEQLRKINELMLIAGGAHKARAVRAAVRAGLGTTLVTDDGLAKALLELGT